VRMRHETTVRSSTFAVIALSRRVRRQLLIGLTPPRGERTIRATEKVAAAQRETAGGQASTLTRGS